MVANCLIILPADDAPITPAPIPAVCVSADIARVLLPEEEIILLLPDDGDLYIGC